jgi:hypothetical protein
MLCELCQDEAVGACVACGAVFCAAHAPAFCFRCAAAVRAAEPGRAGTSTAFVAGDREPRPSGKGYLQCTTVGRPTTYLEDRQPPACYRCRALARRVCHNCQALFCPQHAGGPELCDLCARSSRLGLFVLLGTIGALGLFLLWVWLAG